MQTFYVMFPVGISLSSARLDEIRRECEDENGCTYHVRVTANLCLTCPSIGAKAIVEHMIDESFPPSGFCIASAKSLRRDKLS